MFNCKKVLLNFFACFTFHKKEIKLFNLQKRRNPGSAAPQCFKTNILILSIPEREKGGWGRSGGNLIGLFSLFFGYLANEKIPGHDQIF